MKTMNKRKNNLNVEESYEKIEIKCFLGSFLSKERREGRHLQFFQFC